MDFNLGLQAVQIADHPQTHTIQNILIDLCAAESVVIVDERLEARRLLDGQGAAPGTVRNTYTRDARRMIKNGNTITEFPAPQNLRPRLKRYGLHLQSVACSEPQNLAEEWNRYC